MADAYVVKDKDGTLLLDTLFSTKVGAQANYLHATGIPILDVYSDAVIEEMFRGAVDVRGVSLVEVEVTEKKS